MTKSQCGRISDIRSLIANKKSFHGAIIVLIGYFDKIQLGEITFVPVMVKYHEIKTILWKNVPTEFHWLQPGSEKATCPPQIVDVYIVK